MRAHQRHGHACNVDPYSVWSSETDNITECCRTDGVMFTFI